MKNLKSFSFFIIVLLFLGKSINADAVEIGLNLAQLTTPAASPTPTEPAPTAAPSPNPTTQPSPVNTITPSAQPAQPSPSPTTAPVLSVTAAVSVTVNPTAVLSPVKTATPSITTKPATNVGGENISVTSPTPTPSSSPVTPTLTPSPTPATIPFTIGNVDPPVQKAAEKIFKNVVVSPLSFILQRPQEDFYKENQITKPTSYGLMAFAALGMITGIALLFPKQIMGLYTSSKNKLSGLLTTNSNSFSMSD